MARQSKFPRRVSAGCLFLWLSLALAGCGDTNSGLLLSQVTAEAGRLDLANGLSVDDALSVSYTIGQPARVSAWLEGPAGFSQQLRQNEERAPGDYQLRLNGSYVMDEAGLSQVRLLPNGRFRYLLRAENGSRNQELAGNFEVINSPSTPYPTLENLTANPATISPDFDAREDAADLSWRLSAPAAITVTVTGDNGFTKVLKTVKNSPAQEDKAVFNGLDQRGEPLPDGTYNWTVQATDRWGNSARRAGKIAVRGGGKPEAAIEQASITPAEIIRGNLITVKVRVRNIGKVPIRTQGPDSGYTYSTRDIFSSVENGRHNDQAGFWRVGVDYESSSGGGTSRYPFRWGFGKDLLPGESVEVTGLIRVERPEDQLRFYVGLIQEQIRLPQDRIQPTLIKINY